MTHMIAARCALVGAILSSAAILAAPGPAGNQWITVQVGEQKRTCVVHLPPSYNGRRPLPLVIAVHGAGGTGSGMAAVTGFNAMADKAGFIAAYPDGIVGKNRGWNALFGKAIAGGQGAQVDDVDDVGFIRSLIDQLHNSYHTDPSRVFVCGHSSGAYMAYRVAIDLADRQSMPAKDYQTLKAARPVNREMLKNSRLVSDDHNIFSILFAGSQLRYRSQFNQLPPQLLVN